MIHEGHFKGHLFPGEIILLKELDFISFLLFSAFSLSFVFSSFPWFVFTPLFFVLFLFLLFLFFLLDFIGWFSPSLLHFSIMVESPSLLHFCIMVESSHYHYHHQACDKNSAQWLMYDIDIHPLPRVSCWSGWWSFINWGYCASWSLPCMLSQVSEHACNCWCCCSKPPSSQRSFLPLYIRSWIQNHNNLIINISQFYLGYIKWKCYILMKKISTLRFMHASMQ